MKIRPRILTAVTAALLALASLSDRVLPAHAQGLTCRELLDMGPYRAMDISMEAFDRWNECFDGPAQANQPRNVDSTEAAKLAQIERAKDRKVTTCFLQKRRCTPEWVTICFIDGECRGVLLP